MHEKRNFGFGREKINNYLTVVNFTLLKQEEGQVEGAGEGRNERTRLVGGRMFPSIPQKLFSSTWTEFINKMASFHCEFYMCLLSANLSGLR